VTLAIAIPFLTTYIVDGFEEVLSLFGLGLALLPIVIAADARLALRRPASTRALWRTWAGLHLTFFFALGLAALFKPGWQIGDVSFSQISTGGDLGRHLTGSVLGVLGWLAIGLTSLGLIWPRSFHLAGHGSLATVRFAASLRIPQRVGGLFVSFFTALLPKAEEEAEAEEQSTYVPQWDEQWVESPPPPEPVYPETSAATVEVAVMDEEAEAEPVPDPSTDREESAGFQPALPMGRPAGHGWELPPVGLLAEAAEIEMRPVDNEMRSRLIVDTLASFGVNARVVNINQGPVITQFGVEPGWETKTRTVAVRDERGRPVYDKDGKPELRTEVVSRTRVRVSRITGLANDLSLALAAPTIRIEAPVPGKPIVGIEVPNTTTSLVALRGVIENTSFQKIVTRSNLAMGLGKGVSGDSIAADLAKMPHLLVAGATGSGKSVCINSIIASLLLHNTPEQLRLVLVDPKRVEMTTFAHIPHLAFSRVITDVEEVPGVLQAVINEMDSRYRRFASIGVRNIEAHNKSPRATHKLPYWVVIIDELADLMMAAPYQVERQICRLAQLARATGIHLVVATQRPSVDVVTGLIKANFPTRIAFAVTSQVDSRTIIDGAGAEKLLGRGDMLFMPTDAAKPRRLQGSFVSDQELERLVDWWTNDRFRHLRPDAMDHLLEEVKAEDGEEPETDDDPLYEAAKDLASQHSRISTSLLQRRLHIGYPRAGRLVDMLEEEGIVAAAEGSHSREVLISEEISEPPE
jgi:S-DNA-T family DNA segregation ATPase FtsK/SpoIIIE